MKQRKTMICHNYSKAVNPGYEWNFGDQRLYKSTTRLSNRHIPSYYRLITLDNKSDYSKHSFYPGQKVWIIRRDNRDGRYSVDYDYIFEMYGFGEIGSGALFHYWLHHYGTGHGVEAGDLYLTKQAALYNIRLCSTFISARTRI